VISSSVSRGGFLARGVSVIVGTVGFLYPGAEKAFSFPAHRERSLAFPTTVDGRTIIGVDGPDPSFASGYVVAKTQAGVILQSDHGSRAIRIGPDTLVWKEFNQPADVIQLQDWLDVRGTPLQDGTLEARSEWVWINIGRREGVAEQISAHGVTIRHDKGLETLELSKHLEVINASDESPRIGGIVSLRPGMQIGAVGLRLPGGGFRATRMWT
jgi:hypothetical protein